MYIRSKLDLRLWLAQKEYERSLETARQVDSWFPAA
jgi:hypothetical protein